MGCVSAELNSVFNKSFQRRIGGSSFSKTGQISELKGIVNEFSGKLKEFIEKDIGDWQVWDQVSRKTGRAATGFLPKTSTIFEYLGGRPKKRSRKFEKIAATFSI